MYLVRFDAGAGPRLGCLLGGSEGGEILEAARAVPGLPRDVGALFALGPAVLAALREATLRPDRRAVVPRVRVRLLAPVARPGKILCVGYNYRGHTGDTPDPEFPDVFVKTPNVLIGPNDPILVPAATTQADYEAELAVVIGTRGRQLNTERAAKHIGGYTIFNDMSARDWQSRSSQWALGKSFDTFGPLGPAVLTQDEVPDVAALEVTLSCNGVTTVRSRTSEMIFSPAQLVAYISQVMTLEPGDVIATGTPQKLPGALADQRYLQPGDVVSITIGQLGTLTNPVAAMPTPTSTTSEE